MFLLVALGYAMAIEEWDAKLNFDLIPLKDIYKSSFYSNAVPNKVHTVYYAWRDEPC